MIVGAHSPCTIGHECQGPKLFASATCFLLIVGDEEPAKLSFNGTGGVVAILGPERQHPPMLYSSSPRVAPADVLASSLWRRGAVEGELATSSLSAASSISLKATSNSA